MQGANGARQRKSVDLSANKELNGQNTNDTAVANPKKRYVKESFGFFGSIHKALKNLLVRSLNLR